MASDPLFEARFDGVVVHWRGPAPFFFVGVPGHHVDDVKDAARRASYGWGCVPVEAEANGVAFTTSLFPKDGGYLLPLKVALRKQANISLGDRIAITMIIRDR